MSDGGLRKLFSTYLPLWHWQAIETLSTGQGVPDANYCAWSPHGGIEGWLELKTTHAWRVRISPEQVGWAERRMRAGGRVHLAARRQAKAGVRRGAACDELWLYSGVHIRSLMSKRLDQVPVLGCWTGGPAKWAWPEVQKILVGKKEGTARAAP